MMTDYPLQLADKTGLVCIDESQLKGVLLGAVRQLGGGIVRWNGQDREVEA